jgi:hypothetical protein
MARPSETGSCPAGQAASHLDASRCDPARGIWFGAVTDKEAKGVEDLLTGQTICGECDATLQSYSAKCRVPFPEPCPGFLCVEGARLHLRRRANQEQPQ